MSPPTPPAFILLVVLLPGVWLAGSALARRLACDTRLARLLTPALALALWLSAIHIASLGARSFWIGLPLGTLLVAISGVLGLAWRRGGSARPAIPAFPSERITPTASLVTNTIVADAPSLRGANRRWMWLSALFVTAYLAPSTVGWSFHDELHVTGHLSMASEIENGTYPPRHLSFPQLELRYHYGFDLLVAVVGSILRLNVDRAIDLITLVAWGYSWCLAWAIGERFVGPGWGSGTAAVMLFGGGLPVFSSAPTLAWRLSGYSTVGDQFLNPPVVSYFFQHPWTLGIPLAFATLLVVSERATPAPMARSAAIAILLVALSFSQVVLFACLVGALLVTEPVAGGTLTWRRGLEALVLLGAVLLVASRLHGFFTAPPTGSENMFDFRPLALGGSPGGWVSWHVQTFGLLLPLGIAGLFFLVREQFLVTLLVGGSLLVLNLFQYHWSWDIVKFATVASLALSLSASALLRRLFQLRPRSFGLAIGSLAAAGLVAAGLLFPWVVGFYGRGLQFEGRPVSLSVDDEHAVDWLRRNVRPGEIVYRRTPVGLGYAQWGGLPQLLWDVHTVYYGVPRHLIAERERFVQAAGSVPEAFLRHRVRWLVLDSGNEVWTEMVTRWITDARAAIRAQLGPLTIVEILGPIPPET